MAAIEPTMAVATNAWPGSVDLAITGFSESEPKIQALAPSRTSLGLRRTSQRAMSPPLNESTRATTTGGMISAAMIPAVAYARRGVHAAMSADRPPSTPAVRRACPTNFGTAGSSSAKPAAGSLATRTRPTNRITCGNRSTSSSASMRPAIRATA